MQVIIENLAKESLKDIYYYNSNYSLNNAKETDRNIRQRIHNLRESPYIGRYIPEIWNKHFRELIYRRNRHSSYRIVYYVSEVTNTIHIIYVTNSKQNFYNILKLHNYFKNLLKF